MINSFSASISKKEIQSLPTSAFSGEIIIVDDPATVPLAVEMLKKRTVLGFDTETKPSFKKGVANGVALLQLACRERAFIFRLKKTGLHKQLLSLLSNPGIVKVGASVRDDIISLQKISRFRPAGFVELQQMVKEYDIDDIGLRKLAGIVLGIQISKSQQLSNWERAVLTDQQLVYAATDAWVCHEIYNKLLGSKQS